MGRRFREWRVRRQMQKARRILADLDSQMKAAHITRAERRRFWREVFNGRADISGLIAERK